MLMVVMVVAAGCMRARKKGRMMFKTFKRCGVVELVQARIHFSRPGQPFAADSWTAGTVSREK
jgi:hypothetical protein